MDIHKFITEDLEIKVKVVEKNDIELNLKDVAKGLGFTEIAKSGNISIKWTRIKRHLIELGVIDTSVDTTGDSNLPNFIPEWVFYMLCMKAKNEQARKFQLWISKEILPSLRKNSFYIDDKNLDKEKFRELETQFEKLKLTMFDICEMGKISLGKASELLLGNKHELKERFVKLGWLDYDKCQVVQKKFKASNGKIYELFVYNVSGTYDNGKVNQQLQVSLTNAGFVWLKDKLEQDKDLGEM